MAITVPFCYGQDRSLDRQGFTKAQCLQGFAGCRVYFPVAGFEWGTGFYINPVPPEQAAGFMKEVDVDLTAAKKS
jgi:hypothetical protein